MKNALLIFIAFSIQSCMLNSFDEEVEYSIDPKLQPYLESFYKEAESRGIVILKDNLILKSSTSIGSQSGLSEKKKHGQKVVSINEYIVDSENTLRLKIIVFHELGHALLGRPHLDDRNSIMNTSPCINCNVNDTYLNELFSIN